MDVSVSRQMLVTGDNVGELLLLGLDGQKVCVHPPMKQIIELSCLFMHCLLATKENS